jgi:hypothetical protein
MLTKPLPCLRGLKMILKMCWPSPYQPNEDTKSNLTMCWPNSLDACEDKMCILTYDDQTREIPTRTQNVTKIVFTKTLLCQRGQNLSLLGLTKQVPCQWVHNMHLYMYLPCQRGHKMYLNPSNVSKDRKCISACVDQTPTMPARSQKASQHVSTKTQTCHQEQRKYLKLCWPNLPHACEETKCISTCVDQTPPMQARTQNISQLVLNKPIPCQRGHKMYHILSWLNPSHASEETKYISTCVNQTLHIPARTQNVP